MVRRVGVIGLGVMGRPMARNLLKAGFALVVHNRSQAPVQALVAEGAVAADSPRAVAEQVELVLTVLPDSPDVEAVALGPNGLVEGGRPGLIYVDMSTISPLVSRAIARALAARGIAMLDAPVSGGEKGAVEGTLSIMVGGEAEVVERARPVLEAVGKTITHVGPIGAGGFTKLVNQVVVGVTVAALGEALTLAERAGLDLERTLGALAGGSAGSRLLEIKRGNYLRHRFEPGFTIDLHAKDLGLVLDAARSLRVPVPLSALVQQLFAALQARGLGRLDNSGLLLLFEELAGLPAPEAR